MNKNIAWFFVGLLILGSVFVGYPIYRDSQKQELISACREFRHNWFKKEWEDACTKQGYLDPKCELSNEWVSTLSKAADFQEETCIKQDLPSKYK